MDRFYYQNSIAGFLADSEDAVLGALARSNTFDLVDLQRNAWLYEIRLLKDMLRAEPAGRVVFEYSIPRLGKRIDVVLLLHGIVFVLEFKVGAKEYLRQDLEQVWDYALDLKNFHEASRNLTIIPILVATDADSASVKKEVSHYDDRVFEPISANAEALPGIIAQFIAGAILVIDPGLAQRAADAVGVGRGTDLLLYLLILLVYAGGIVVLAKFRRLERQITQLTRELALAKAPPPPK